MESISEYRHQSAEECIDIGIHSGAVVVNVVVAAVSSSYGVLDGTIRVDVDVTV